MVSTTDDILWRAADGETLSDLLFAARAAGVRLTVEELIEAGAWVARRESTEAVN